MKSFLKRVKKLISAFGKRKVKAAVALLAVVAIPAVIILNNYAGNVGNGLANNLIRLHVIANSDSPEDQELKRNVRDAVIDYIQTELKGVSDIEETRKLLAGRLDEIKSVAEQEILEHGRKDKVTAYIGNYPFPTKVYGDIKLPAGNYQALRVVIGEGEGANWWCVLFPPLCFIDVTHGAVPESAKEDLKAVLSEEEYSIITMAESENDIPIKIKFKIVELFQDSRIKVANVINRIFGNES